MTEQWQSPRKIKADADAAILAAKQNQYERFDRWIDDETLPRAIAITAFIDEVSYLDERPDELRN